MKVVMPHAPLKKAEHDVQHRFNFVGWAGAGAIAAIVGLVALTWSGAPDRFAMAPRTVALHAEALPLDPSGVLPLRLAGAWRLTADDPRFGGVSALTLDGGRLLALNDNGVVLRFAPPGEGRARVTLRDLADGPGSAGRKIDRDSESLTRDAGGRGWWVGFETSNQLWLYTPDFRGAVRRLDFGTERWPQNTGIEAMTARPGQLLLVPESAQEVVTMDGGRATARPLVDANSPISDMVRLPDGEMIVLLRDLGRTGFSNALAALVQTPTGWRIERRVPLALGAFMNLEGLAAQRLADGTTRLWLITDDNFKLPMTTALFALDVPAGGWRGTKPD